MNITVETFPRIIKQIRAENGWNTKELAGRLNVSPRTVEFWEQGRPPAKYLIPLINEILKAGSPVIRRGGED
jgi:DNA-binding transcriptional regulator YiaG